MKILPLPLIREADTYTITNEPIAGIDLMERAAKACFGWLRDNIPSRQKIKFFCGTGNNGGDGLAIARMMTAAGYDIDVFITGTPEKMSENCRINYDMLQETGCRIRDGFIFPDIAPADLVIDALFGNGVTRPIEGAWAGLIRHINKSGAMVTAIDLPSGLFCDAHTMRAEPGGVILADHTLTFSPAKLALFFPENDEFLGEWHLLEIGLSHEFIESAETRNFMVDAAMVAPMLKRREKFSHKGNFGHSLIIAGSAGKMGAAVLSCLACLRSGSGLVTARIPGSGISVLQSAVPEAMLVADPHERWFSELPDISFYTSIGAGPGIGLSKETSNALKLLIQQFRGPVVFDADALNILAENKTWLSFLPPSSILTPHPKEFERLAGKTANHFERNDRQREFSVKYQCYTVLKGAHTAITTPEGACFFNTTGNPGMATAGSGDVLTGIITGLLAQGYSSLESSILGVYLHGMAGDCASLDTGYEALIARDIINNLGNSFQHLYGKF